MPCKPSTAANLQARPRLTPARSFRDDIDTVRTGALWQRAGCGAGFRAGSGWRAGRPGSVLLAGMATRSTRPRAPAALTPKETHPCGTDAGADSAPDEAGGTKGTGRASCPHRGATRGSRNRPHPVPPSLKISRVTFRRPVSRSAYVDAAGQPVAYTDDIARNARASGVGLVAEACYCNAAASATFRR
jgi:hypothetical protein